jgi:hypothetical protein
VQEVHDKLAWYASGVRLWGRSYYTALVLGILLSAAAGLVLKLDSLSKWRHQKDTAALLAGLAAVVGTGSATDFWNFHTKWIAHRACYVATDQLRLDATDPTFPADSIRARLKLITAEYEERRNGRDPKPK